ncbi:DUF928 domain-containing protein [Acaryochloris sp. IP29b_bin.148]|uniref:DUF928 domain-containing protein n=1 Tax=Acaryochloris sp. IP29b_bin.148 TaxID=2969218 RepID=UPI002610F06E|nr:DUF928 domain-containing protein [Acaryochloris sp. IP29b_bin.148]
MLSSQGLFRSVTLSLSIAVLSWVGSGSLRLMAMQPHHGTQFKIPTTTQDPGAPIGRREGGSSRGKNIFALCTSVEEVASQQCATARLTALVPETTDTKQVWGLTTADHPEFLFYLSKFRNPSDPAITHLPIEFVLQDENDQYIYKASFVLPLTEGGIIRIPVPATSTPLNVGQRYTWTLYTRFHPDETNFVHGTIYRTQLTAQRQQQLDTATPLQRLDIALQEGLWFDALSTLVDLQRANPKDLKLRNQWASLLHDINLNELAAEPMLSCCTPEPHVSLK